MIEINYDDKGRIVHQGWRYKAIQELHTRLEELQIPHNFAPMHDGYKIWVPLGATANFFELDTIQHFGSYGAEDDLLEVLDIKNESDPEGWLTVDEALEYFVKWWEERSGGNAQVHTSGV